MRIKISKVLPALILAVLACTQFSNVSLIKSDNLQSHVICIKIPNKITKGYDTFAITVVGNKVQEVNKLQNKTFTICGQTDKCLIVGGKFNIDIATKDFKESKPLTKDYVEVYKGNQINEFPIMNDWIYYIVSNPSERNIIKKIKLDGTNLTSLGQAGIDFRINNGKIFFIGNDLHLYMMDLDGKNKKVISKEDVTKIICVTNDRVDYMVTPKLKSIIYSIKIDGSDKKSLTKDMVAQVYYQKSQNGEGDYIYYTTDNLHNTDDCTGDDLFGGDIYRVKPDGTGRKKLKSYTNCNAAKGANLEDKTGIDKGYWVLGGDDKYFYYKYSYASEMYDSCVFNSYATDGTRVFTNDIVRACRLDGTTEYILPKGVAEIYDGRAYGYDSSTGKVFSVNVDGTDKKYY